MTTSNVARPPWHYGPTATDPDPGKMWCDDCRREVYWFDGIGTCGCGQWEDEG